MRDARQTPHFTPFLSPVLNLNTVIVAVHELWGLAGQGKGLQFSVQKMKGERRRAPGAVVPTQKLTFHCPLYCPGCKMTSGLCESMMGLSCCLWCEWPNLQLQT